MDPYVFSLNEALGQGDQEESVRALGNRTDRWVTSNYASFLSVSLPKSGKPTAAVVICPGGGYKGLSYDKEGTFVAKWMNERGVAAGVLKYRTGGGAHQHPAPMDDVQLALQTMRAKAAEYRYPTDKIGVMGFSAGGHLAATAATHFKQADPTQDNSELPASFSSRPNFAVLVYPVISMRESVTHGGSRRNLLGSSPTNEMVAEMSADEQVSDQTPPTFLMHTTEDRAVPAENSIRFYRACVEHHVPAEMHLFERGPHGVGMWAKGIPAEHWPKALEAWMNQHKLIAE